MFCCKLLCISQKSVKITPVSNGIEIKTCNKCNVLTSLITLKCGHIYCVNCYNKSKYLCRECEKKKSTFRLFR